MTVIWLLWLLWLLSIIVNACTNNFVSCLMALMETVTVCSPPSVCINTEEVDALPDTRTVSQTRCTQPIPVPPSVSTESGRAILQNRCRRATLARVCGWSGFWGAYSRLLAPSAQPTLIQFFVVGDVRGTALSASACIDCVGLHRTYTWDVSCEWSHWCLEHRSLRWVHYVLRNYACFTIVYCLCE
jgi:hypothetical protein